MDRNTAVKRVNDALRGPVADIFSRLLPELHGLTHADVYQKALDDLGVLERCFEKFRSERHWFRHVVVDSRSRPVLDDTVVLTCGRTLEEVIAMVVRSAAKRYFRRVRLADKAQATSSTDDTGDDDALYEAIKDYLMHEWQVPLVPAYADMSPGLVRALGSKLLAIREVSELRRIIASASAKVTAAPAPTASGLPLPHLPDDPYALLLSLDGRRLRVDGFAPILQRADVTAALAGSVYVDQAQSVLGVLSDVGGPAARLLINGLKVTPDQLLVMLATAHEAMGHGVFTRLFGFPGQPELVLRVVSQGLSDKIGPATPLIECAGFIRSFVGRAVQAGKGDGSGAPAEKGKPN